MEVQLMTGDNGRLGSANFMTSSGYNGGDGSNFWGRGLSNNTSVVRSPIGTSAKFSLRCLKVD